VTVNAVECKTVIEEVEACITAVKEKVKDDTRARVEMSGMVPAGTAFWKKFAASSFNRSFALTESSRVKDQNMMSDDEAKGVDELQNRITSVVEEARLRCLQQNGTVEEAIRLAHCCWEGASLHNVVMPLEDRLSLRDWEYRSATRHQYGMVPIIAAGREWYCKCGHVVSAGHNHTCRRVVGPATLHRHQCVVKALADVAKQECGLIVEETPRVWSEVKDKEEESYVIPDLIFSGHDFKLAIDVSGVYGEAESYIRGDVNDRSSLSALRRTAAIVAREKAKRVKYAALPESGEMEFLPFVFESHGGLGESARTVIERLAKYRGGGDWSEEMAMVGYLKRAIAIAIQRGNAGLDSVARSRQAGSYGARVARGMMSGGSA
jgi:hypothetical protein